MKEFYLLKELMKMLQNVVNKIFKSFVFVRKTLNDENMDEEFYFDLSPEINSPSLKYYVT